MKIVKCHVLLQVQAASETSLDSECSPGLVSSVLQDPSGRSGGGKDLPEELLPPLSLQEGHVEPADNAQAHVTSAHTCRCTMTTVAMVTTANRALYRWIVSPPAATR